MFCALLLIKKMLFFLFFFPPSPQSIDQLIEDTVPSSIRMQRTMKMDDPVCKFTFIWKYRFNNLILWHPHRNAERAARPASVKWCQKYKYKMYVKVIAFIPLVSSLFCTVRLGVEWSRVSGWNVGCTSIVCRGALSPVKSSFEHIWSCFCETRRAAPISCWEADAHRMATGV